MKILNRWGAEEQKITDDPYAVIIDEMHDSYPYGAEGIGIRSFMRLIVWTVLEMNRRGLLK